jgi:hypothetical protein
MQVATSLVNSEIDRVGQEAFQDATNRDDTYWARWELMAGHGSKSDRQREEAIIALLSQNSVEEAARAVGIGATTLFRWLKEPEFDAACRQANVRCRKRIALSDLPQNAATPSSERRRKRAGRR